MSAERLAGALLLVSVASIAAAQQAEPRRAAIDVEQAQDELHAADQLLATLFELQQRVRTGALPTDAELAVARVTREEILAGFDVRLAARLGIEPSAVRDRLQPGFLSELDLLAAQRSRLDVGPLPEPSPILTMVLDVEQDLWREADRRRRRAGLKSPIDSGPLAQKLQPDAPPPEGAAGTEANGAAASAAAPSILPNGADPRLAGQAHYKAGRFVEALAAWNGIASPEGGAGIEFAYQHADCLMRSGKVDEAIAEWEKLAADHPATTWAAQSQFSLRVARTLKAVREVKQAAGGGK